MQQDELLFLPHLHFLSCTVIFLIIIIAHHRAWTYMSSAENISSHEFCCFTSDRVHPVSEQSFPKFEFGSPSVPALNRRKRRKTEKKPKLSEVHVIAALSQLKNHPRIAWKLCKEDQFCSSKPLNFNIVFIWFVFVHPSALRSPISVF